MFGICQMVLWPIGFLRDHFDPRENWSVESLGRYNGFLSLKVNVLSIQSVLLLACYTARATRIFMNLFYGIHY